MERHFAATCPGFAAPPPLLVPNLAALPHATWPWPAERHSSTAAQPPSGQGQPADRHRAYTPREYQPAAAWLSQQPANRGSMQPPHERQPAAAAAGAMHEPDGRSASLADKTTQWPECVDRQTQTEPPEPDTLPASRCKKIPASCNLVVLPASRGMHTAMGWYCCAASPHSTVWAVNCLDQPCQCQRDAEASDCAGSPGHTHYTASAIWARCLWSASRREQHWRRGRTQHLRTPLSPECIHHSRRPREAQRRPRKALEHHVAALSQASPALLDTHQQPPIAHWPNASGKKQELRPASSTPVRLIYSSGIDSHKMSARSLFNVNGLLRTVH